MALAKNLESGSMTSSSVLLTDSKGGGRGHDDGWASKDRRPQVAMKTEPFVVNIGPQHPSTHGVFRMRLTLDGERITDADMVIGYLHRSMEKLAGEGRFHQVLPSTAR